MNDRESIQRKRDLERDSRKGLDLRKVLDKSTGIEPEDIQRKVPNSPGFAHLNRVMGKATEKA